MPGLKLKDPTKRTRLWVVLHGFNLIENGKQFTVNEFMVNQIRPLDDEFNILVSRDYANQILTYLKKAGYAEKKNRYIPYFTKVKNVDENVSATDLLSEGRMIIKK